MSYPARAEGLVNSIILLFTYWEFFTSALADGFFTGVWVTASLLKSSELFSLFWPFSIMLYFGWSPLLLQLPSPLSPFNNPLVTVPKAPITIGIIITFIFYGFFNSKTSSRYLSFFSHFFSFYSVVSRNHKVHSFGSSHFFCCLL